MDSPYFWDFQFHSKQREVSVTSVGNGFCVRCCRGQKKQVEELARDIVLSMYYLASI